MIWTLYELLRLLLEAGCRPTEEQCCCTWPRSRRNCEG